jgi:hypothetical protein
MSEGRKQTYQGFRDESLRRGELMLRTNSWTPQEEHLMLVWKPQGKISLAEKAWDAWAT